MYTKENRENQIEMHKKKKQPHTIYLIRNNKFVIYIQ